LYSSVSYEDLAIKILNLCRLTIFPKFGAQRYNLLLLTRRNS